MRIVFGCMSLAVFLGIIILQIPSFCTYYGRRFLGYETFSSFLIAISASFRIFASSKYVITVATFDSWALLFVALFVD